jgi:hypothetical protein
MSGMLGALLVTLLVIGAFVVFRALNRDQIEIRPEAVDYLSAVRAAQGAGLQPVYPASLPEGWIATSVDLRRGADPAWGIGMLAADGTFAGLRQGGGSLDDLLRVYVDSSPVEGEPVTVSGSVATSWRVFSDSGGDRALATEIDGVPLLVYGSANDADLRLLVGLLTTAAR